MYSNNSLHLHFLLNCTWKVPSTLWSSTSTLTSPHNNYQVLINMYLSTSTVLDRNPGKHNILGGLVIKIRLCYIESNFNNGLNFLRNILKIIKIAVITPSIIIISNWIF